MGKLCPIIGENSVRDDMFLNRTGDLGRENPRDLESDKLLAHLQLQKVHLRVLVLHQLLSPFKVKIWNILFFMILHPHVS